MFADASALKAVRTGWLNAFGHSLEEVSQGLHPWLLTWAALRRMSKRAFPSIKPPSCSSEAKLDFGRKSHDNREMEILGHLQNGVIVLDGSVSLPEGAAVTVIVRSSPVMRFAKNPKRVEFPLVHSTAPGSVHLTNERIAEILDEEDIDALKRD